MTELEKKQAGEIYDARDKELRKKQNFAKNMMREHNSIPAENIEERQKYLKQMLGKLGKNARVNQPFYVDYGSNIFLEDNTFINMNCTLLDTGKISIGRNTLIGPDVKIYTAVHDKEWHKRFWEEPEGNAAVKTWVKPVHIGKYVWIGGGATILPGVTIGDYAIIGAGAVINKDIPAGAVAVGNPCMIKDKTEMSSEMLRS